MSVRYWSVLLVLFTLRATVVAGQGSPTDPVVDFLKANPGRSALYLIRNDTVLISLRPDQPMPLASTLKTIIAVEFARQVAAGRLSATERVPLADLDLYYLPRTDGNAHPNWKTMVAQQKLDSAETVSLLEVAKGMIQFSSNANTEYLTDRLGLANVNANLKTLGLTHHAPIYPLVSSLFLYSVAPADSAHLLKQVRELSPTAYAARCQALHEQLKQDKSGQLKRAFYLPSLALQKQWSDRLPKSTVRDYASVMQKIASRTYFASPVQAVLDTIMEWPFRINPGNRAVYKHLGMKGGSTAFVLTNAFYAEMKNGDRIAAAFFTNDLTLAELAMLTSQLNNLAIRCFDKTSSRSLVGALMR